jgi:hypothetical protein
LQWRCDGDEQHAAQTEGRYQSKRFTVGPLACYQRQRQDDEYQSMDRGMKRYVLCRCGEGDGVAFHDLSQALGAFMETQPHLMIGGYRKSSCEACGQTDEEELLSMSSTTRAERQNDCRHDKKESAVVMNENSAPEENP